MARERAKIVGFLAILTFAAMHTAAAQDVSFPSRTETGNELLLRGTLHRPEGEGPFPGLVMLYGSEGMTHAAPQAVAQHAQWVQRLVDWGYVALELDSATPRGRDSNDGYVTYSMRSRDSYAAKSYLSALPFVDPQRIGVIGWSHGAIAVLTIVDAVYFREKTTSPFKAAVAFYPICHKLIRPDTPLLVLTGRKDEQCPVSFAESLEKDAKNASWEREFSMVIYPNATHAFDFEELAGGYVDPYGHHMDYDPEATADAVLRTRDFFSKYLKNGE